jgi:hypothetical protein
LVFWVGLDAERYAVTALHGLMRRKVCDVEENILVACVGLDESERITVPKYYVALKPIIFVSHLFPQL